MRLTHVRLENWRNFRQVDVELQGRVFLVGPNASGKSNFLDAFRFLKDIVSVGGGFQAAVERRKGIKAIRSLAARARPNVTLAVMIGADSESPLWEYELSFALDKQRRPVIRRELVSHEGETILQRPDDADRADPERLTQTYLEQVNVNRRFRQVAEFLASVRYLHIVPQLVREPERSVGRTDDPFGGDFLEQVARTPKKTRDARLRRIQKALTVAVPQLNELKLEQDVKGVWHILGKYEHWRPQGAWQTEDQFSDGTLRLMGLLWAVLDGAGPLLLEEPELSLHPEVVRFLPPMFHRVQRKSGRQVLVSSHSSDLLQDSGIGLDEVLLLIPAAEGTDVRPANAFSEVPALLSGGLSLADAVVPKTRPAHAEQLAMFSEMT
jgi:predicted ATPase